jgi:hypothetical protein
LLITNRLAFSDPEEWYNVYCTRAIAEASTAKFSFSKLTI